MSSSVIVIGSDDRAPRHLTPRAVAKQRRKPHRRLCLFLAVVSAHAAFGWVIADSPGERIRRAETETLVAVFLRPRIVVTRLPSDTRPPLQVPKDAPPLNDVQVSDFARPIVAVLGVGTMPPHPDAVPIDPAPFAREAGLNPGEGATVVLRLEVLGSGEVGRVEVDVSGGAPEIDRQAIAYVKSLLWTGGMIDGRPATIWIRWGVRLQA